MRYVWKNLITADVPADWVINEPGDVIELVPPTEDGALHISILERDRDAPPRSEDARELVDWFKERRGADASTHVETGSDGIPVGRAEFVVAEDGEPMRWLVVAKVWAPVAALVSYCSGPESRQRTAAVEEIISSIQAVTANAK